MTPTGRQRQAALGVQQLADRLGFDRCVCVFARGDEVAIVAELAPGKDRARSLLFLQAVAEVLPHLAAKLPAVDLAQ